MRLTTRSLRAAATAAVAGAAALTMTAIGAAQADDTGVRVSQRAEEAQQAQEGGEPYTLLDAGDLPPAPTPWTAGPVGDGSGGERFCVGTRVPDTGSVHRDFFTELDTSADQTVHEAATVRDAKRLTTELRDAVEHCAERLAEQYPGATVRERDHGRFHAIQTDMPESSRDVNLVGVARSGKFVTVVRWGQMGPLESAPVGDFRDTLRTAAHKLR
ncbi:hypothetical protein [Streptomyces sp. GSL17-111]|uniref:hypothetical protein n=1 Tax=Streptomyces sp. GSL17-111 TaxID=3121596 RepID=UPI0030F399C8